jgi:hypothetical protein
MPLQEKHLLKKIIWYPDETSPNERPMDFTSQKFFNEKRPSDKTVLFRQNVTIFMDGLSVPENKT